MLPRLVKFIRTFMIDSLSSSSDENIPRLRPPRNMLQGRTYRDKMPNLDLMDKPQYFANHKPKMMFEEERFPMAERRPSHANASFPVQLGSTRNPNERNSFGRSNSAEQNNSTSPFKAAYIDHGILLSSSYDLDDGHDAHRGSDAFSNLAVAGFNLTSGSLIPEFPTSNQHISVAKEISEEDTELCELTAEEFLSTFKSDLARAEVLKTLTSENVDLFDTKAQTLTRSSSPDLEGATVDQTVGAGDEDKNAKFDFPLVLQKIQSNNQEIDPKLRELYMHMKRLNFDANLHRLSDDSKC